MDLRGTSVLELGFITALVGTVFGNVLSQSSTTSQPRSSNYDSLLGSLANLCAAQSDSQCPAGVQFCTSHGECPASHVCSCVKGCSRLQCTLEQGACYAPHSPTNGYSIQHGTFTHFGCQRGYTLLGPERKQCDNGIWTPENAFPRCIADGGVPSSACDSRPCRNGGTCQESRLSVTGYVCSCPVGVDGEQCENVWLQKEDYQALVNEVVWLRQELRDMVRQLQDVNRTAHRSSNIEPNRPGIPGDVTSPPTSFPSTFPVTHSQEILPTSPTEPDRSVTTESDPIDLPAVTQTVFRWPSSAVDEPRTTPFSISLRLPHNLTSNANLLIREHVLQLQDWLPWTQVPGYLNDVASCALKGCQAGVYTIKGLRPQTTYQFTALLNGSDANSRSLGDLDIVEARTLAEGVPLWPDSAFLEALSSPVSAVFRLAKVNANDTSLVAHYSVAYRYRRSSTWSRWREIGGKIKVTQRNLEIPNIPRSAMLQVIVTSHLIRVGSLTTVDSPVLEIQLPEEVYQFPGMPLPPHEIRRTSVIFNVPTVAAQYNVTEMRVYLRYLTADGVTFSSWRSIVRLPLRIRSYRLQDLRPSRTYQLRVRGYAGLIPLQYSSVLSFNTPSAGVPVWNIVSIADRTATSITINLPKIDTSSGISAQYYMVSYQGYGPRSPSGWQPGVGPVLPDVAKATISDLLPDTRYDIRVQATVNGGGETTSSAWTTRTLAAGAPIWLMNGLDIAMTDSSSIVVNVPVVSDTNVRYVINMRSWLSRLSLWSEWTSVMRFTLSNGIGSKVQTSLTDSGRKYIPVRIGPLSAESFFQFTVQYEHIPGMQLSPTSSTRTAKTLASGTPVWGERPVLALTPTTAQLKMARVPAAFTNRTTHYTAQYRFAEDHVNVELTGAWRQLALTFSPSQAILNMVGLPPGGTVEIQVIAHSETGASNPSPSFRVLLPKERLRESNLSPTSANTNSPLNVADEAVLRSSCGRFCCALAATTTCSTEPVPLDPEHICRARLSNSFCSRSYQRCCLSLG
eukprot:scpid25461/ scgid5027/ Fibulin-7